MIRLHLVWAAMPVGEEATHTAQGSSILRRSMEIYRMLPEFQDHITISVEDRDSPREESERARSASNYVVYLIDPVKMGPKLMVDLALDLVNRPKRTVPVLCRHSVNDFMNAEVEEMVVHLLSKFSDVELLYCDTFNKFRGFLESHLPQ